MYLYPHMAKQLYNTANSSLKICPIEQESSAVSTRRHDRCLYSARRKPWLLMNIACEVFLGAVFFARLTPLLCRSSDGGQLLLPELTYPATTTALPSDEWFTVENMHGACTFVVVGQCMRDDGALVLIVFGIEVGQTKIFFHSVPEQNVRDREIWSDEKGLFHNFHKISCQFFHTQNVRGPDEAEGVLSSLCAKKLFHACAYTWERMEGNFDCANSNPNGCIVGFDLARMEKLDHFGRLCRSL
jgi:hypothetical protein